MPKKLRIAPDAPAHFFRWKWGKSEIEANGLGLIPAVIALFLFVALLGFGGSAFRKAFDLVIEWKQAQPSVIEKPPP